MHVTVRMGVPIYRLRHHRDNTFGQRSLNVHFASNVHYMDLSLLPKSLIINKLLQCTFFSFFLSQSRIQWLFFLNFDLLLRHALMINLFENLLMTHEHDALYTVHHLKSVKYIFFSFNIVNLLSTHQDFF